MLDLEQRQGEAGRGTHSQLAGLKRLSARASAGPSTPPGTRRVFFSFSAYARSVIDHLKRCDVPIAEGLADEEFSKIEATYGFTFPPDLKGILQEGVPVGSGFPNWRSSDVQHLKMRLNLPVLGLLHEVANATFWWKAWGPRPVDLEVAIRTARAALRKFPLLIPMYGHCYIASSPNLAGNPVFFVYQKDVVYCGYDVADFFERDAFRAHECDPDDWQERARSSSVSGSDQQKDGDSTRRCSSSSEASGESETWGRNLDVLAKNLSTPRSSRGNIFSRFGRSRSKNVHRQQVVKTTTPEDTASVETDSPRSSICQDDIVRYGQILEKPLPPKTLMNLSMAVPPWAARSPRRIEFWSDLAEKHLKQLGGGAESVQEVNVAAPLSPVKENPVERKDAKAGSKWLTVYLEEMSLVLRQGGWEEDDISDMMDSKTAPDLWNQHIDAEAVLATLAKEVELLSSSLKKAGWSVPDVAESMKMGSRPVW